MKQKKTYEAHKIILWCFIFASGYVILYEFWLTNYPSYSGTVYKMGLITSKISYSILATSIFYYLSQYIPVYLPRQQRKIKILSNVYQKTLIINSIVGGLKLNLNITDDIDFTKRDNFLKIINNTNPDEEVSRFENWHYYLYNLKTNLLDIIRSMTFYNDYLSKEFLHELIILEKVLLAPYTFAGYKTIGVSNLSYAEIDLQEILVHNGILQDLRTKEFKKYERQFEDDGKLYRETYYNEQSR
jgi:hypothetical protein